MAKFILVFLLFSLTLSFSQKHEETAIRNTIHLFFEGLQNGDTIKLKKTLYKDFILQSVNTDSIGNNVLHQIDKKQFIKIVANKNPDDLWCEDLILYRFNIEDGMANVWTPFKFYLNNKLSHCGVNLFQLFKNNGEWKLI